MEFTNKELYEIEKVFDSNTIPVLDRLVQLIVQLDKFQNGEVLSKKLFQSSVELYNMYRSISAKASTMRERGINANNKTRLNAHKVK